MRKCKTWTQASWELEKYQGDLVSSDDFDPYLHMAARDGNLNQVKAAVENLHFDVNRRDNDGETPLANAARCGQREPRDGADYAGTVKYLLAKMAQTPDDSLTVPEWRFSHALWLAINFASMDVTQLLIRATKRMSDLERALFVAAERADKLPELLSELIRKFRPNKGELSEALAIAVDLDRPIAIKALLDAGANPMRTGDHISSDRRSAMQIATDSEDTKLIKQLASRIS